MSYIFMDESGDLGFDLAKRKTSRFFIVTFVLARDRSDLDRMVKKIFRGLNRNGINHRNGTLHAHKESPKTVRRLLSLFSEKKKASIIVIYLEKGKMRVSPRNQKHALYNHITNTLLDRVFAKKLISTTEKVRIIASRRETSKFLNGNFSSYLKDEAGAKHGLDIEVTITSPSDKGLQVADAVCWAIFRKHEYGDASYYDIIKAEIVEENPLF
jgi:hypothetical protein